MTPRIILGVVALMGCSVCGLLATFANLEMVDKVNEKLPVSEKFEQFGWYLSKTLRLRRKYRMLYPEGRLVSRVYMLAAVGFVCLLIAAWGFGIIAR